MPIFPYPNHMRMRSITTFCFILISSLVEAQTSTTQSLDEYFEHLESNNRFMGSVALMKAGKLVYKRTSGFADVESGRRADEETQYRIGSITKTFTAVLIFQAIEDGKLSLATKLQSFYPDIPNAATITIEHLLSHRSGIFNFTDAEDYLSWNTRPHSEKMLVDIITGGGSVFEPGSTFGYSNSNYVLLTLILQKLYGKSYAQLLQEKITTPLHLARTTVGGITSPNQNQAHSYQWDTDWKKQQETDMSVPLGAGAIISTPKDITFFMKALFDNQLLSANSFNMMLPSSGNVGMGLFQFPFNDKKVYGHTGGIDGFFAVTGYIPADDIAFAITTNGSRINNNNVSIAVLSNAYGLPITMPTISDYTHTATQLAALTGVYSSDNIPLKIEVTVKGSILQAQATGQPAFPLESFGENIFRFDAAGVVMEFSPADNKMRLKQNGMTFFFEKD